MSDAFASPCAETLPTWGHGSTNGRNRLPTLDNTGEDKGLVEHGARPGRILLRGLPSKGGPHATPMSTRPMLSPEWPLNVVRRSPKAKTRSIPLVNYYQ